MLYFGSMKKAEADASKKANQPSKAESRENRTDNFSKKKTHKVKIKGKIKNVYGWL